MRANVVATLFDPLDNVGCIFAHQAIEQMRRRQAQFVEHAEDAPDPDPKPVISPGIIALGLRPASLRRIGAATCQKGEPLDVESDVKGKTLAAGPAEIRPLFNW